MIEALEKTRSDFNLLLNPTQFLVAYQEIIKVTEKNTAKSLLNEATKLKEQIDSENSQLQSLISTHGKYLSEYYINYLKNLQIPIFIRMKSGDDSELIKNSVQSEISSKDLSSQPSQSSHLAEEYAAQKAMLRKELEAIQKDFETQKNDNDAIISSLNSKISELENAHLMKDSDMKRLEKQLKLKVDRIQSMEKEQETLNKTILDLTNNIKEQLTKKQFEIDKKEKEVHNLLLDIQNNTLRKKNCAFCGELIEFKGNRDEYLNEINEKLIEKNSKIKQLEEKLEQSNRIISTASSSLFNLMSSKVNDKEFKLMAIKEQYEAKLMEAEEYLASEHARSAILVKQRVSEATERAEEAFKAESNAQKEKLSQMEKKISYYEKENKRTSSLLQNSIIMEKNLKQEVEQLKRDYRMKKEALLQKDAMIKQTIEMKNKLQHELDELKSSASTNSQENEARNKLILNLKEECGALKKDITSTRVSLKEKDKLLLTTTEKNAELQRQFSELKQEKERLTTSLLQMTEEKNNINQKLTILQAEMNSAQSLHDEEIKKLTDSHKDSLKELEIYKNQVSKEDIESKYKNQIEERQNTIKSLKNELQELNNKLNSYIINEKKLNKNLVEAQNQIEIHKNSIKTLQQSIEVKTKEMNSKDQELQQCTNTLNEQTRKISLYSKQIEDHIRENQQLQETLQNSVTTKKYSSSELNYSIIDKGNRMLFICFSPGIYVAFMLQDLSGEEKKQLTGKKSGMSVTKKKLENYIFLDIDSLSKNLQTILKNYSMLVIGVIKEINLIVSSGEANPFGIPKDQKYHLCTLSKLENIVGFEGKEALLTNYEFLTDSQ